MASYVTLGSRYAQGAPDTTGNNTGRWTIGFTTAILGINLPFFEVYKIVVQGAANSTLDIFVDSRQWDTTIAGDNNSWDPNQPLTMNPGENLYLYWSDPVSDNTPPSATIWLRYDQSLSVNQQVVNTV